MENEKPTNNPAYYTDKVTSGLEVPDLGTSKSLGFTYTTCNMDGSPLSYEGAQDQLKRLITIYRITNLEMHKNENYSPFTIGSTEDISKFMQIEWKKSLELYGKSESLTAKQCINRSKFLVGQMLYLYDCFDYADLKAEEEREIEIEFWTNELRREDSKKISDSQKIQRLSELNSGNIFEGQSDFTHTPRGQKLGSVATGAIATDNRNYKTHPGDKLIDIYEKETTQLMHPNGPDQSNMPTYDDRMIGTPGEPATKQKVSFVDNLNEQKQALKSFREKASGKKRQ